MKSRRSPREWPIGSLRFSAEEHRWAREIVPTAKRRRSRRTSRPAQADVAFGAAAAAGGADPEAAQAEAGRGRDRRGLIGPRSRPGADLSVTERIDRSVTTDGDDRTAGGGRAERRAIGDGPRGRARPGGARQGRRRGDPVDREAVRDRLDHEARRGSIGRQVDFIPTGSIALDLALGVGGIPRGRITEIFGPESSGKTTVCQHVIAEAQRARRRGRVHRRRARARPGLRPGLRRQRRRAPRQPAGHRRAGARDHRDPDPLRRHRLSSSSTPSRRSCRGRRSRARWATRFVGIQARLMSQALRKLTGAV